MNLERLVEEWAAKASNFRRMAEENRAFDNFNAVHLCIGKAEAFEEVIKALRKAGVKA